MASTTSTTQAAVKQEELSTSGPRFEDVDIKGNTYFDGFADQTLRDHPAISDLAYRARRRFIIDLAVNSGDGLPVVEYTPTEHATWGVVLRAMRAELPTKACREYNRMFALLGFSDQHVPCLPDISRRLSEHSGWRLHAVGGYLEPRIFLNCLNFRVFPVIPFLRHQDRPFYSIEPDICHELLGHVPMLADKDFAELCQMIGSASIGASDDVIKRLANVYWHFVEFGLVQENDERKAFGAAVVSCIHELNNALGGKVELKEFEPYACEVDGDHPVTLVQPSYYVAKSIEDAKQQIKRYVQRLCEVGTA